MKTFIRKCFDHYVVTKRRAYGTQITLGIFVLPKRRPAGFDPECFKSVVQTEFFIGINFCPDHVGQGPLG